MRSINRRPTEFLRVRNPRKAFAFCIAVAGTLASACTQGAGEGAVTSDRLFIRNCWNAGFNLQPTFFGASPFSLDQMAIRVQRGDDNEDVSDGLSVIVNDVQTIRNSELGVPLPVGLPPGVSPPGMPLRINPNPPSISLALYLQGSCNVQNSAIYSIGGTIAGDAGTPSDDAGTATSDSSITFNNLFSGNLNETNSDNRLTFAHFDAIFADPRDMNADYTFSSDVTSRVTGWFKFYFQRGQPAQPFP